MNGLTEIPEWLAAAALGALLAALGYVGRLAVESAVAYRERRAARRARLVALHALLGASRAAFAVQREHARRLLAMVRERHPELARLRGYERTFAAAYALFSPEEEALHGIIRGITVHSLRPTNQALLRWLEADTYFKAHKPRHRLGALARQLGALEAHLILWQAKYESWIPDQPAHALVYLADEEAHGVGFPKGLDALVRAALE